MKDTFRIGVLLVFAAPLLMACDGGVNDAYRDFRRTERGWIVRQGGPSADTLGQGVAVDAGGNSVSVGTTSEPLGAESQKGAWDLYVVKRDANGASLWTRQFGLAAFNTFGGAVTMDAAGSIWVVGYTNGDLGGHGVPELAGTLDVIVIRLSSDGELLWGPYQIDTALYPFGSNPADPLLEQGIAVDGEFCYVSGKKTLIDGGVRKGEAVFAAKFSLDAAGTESYVWLKTFGYFDAVDATWAEGKAIATDGKGNCFIAGGVYGKLDLTGGAYNNDTGYYDALLLRLDADGVLTWAHRFPQAGQGSWALGVAVGSDGIVYTAGGSDSSGNTNMLIFVKAFNPEASGDPLVAEFATEPSSQWIYLNGLALDAANNVYVVGGADAAVFGAPPIGSIDCFVMKLSRITGNPKLQAVWTALDGTSGKETWGTGLCTAGGVVYTVGLTQEMSGGNIVAGSMDALVTNALRR